MSVKEAGIENADAAHSGFSRSGGQSKELGIRLLYQWFQNSKSPGKISNHSSVQVIPQTKKKNHSAWDGKAGADSFKDLCGF